MLVIYKVGIILSAVTFILRLQFSMGKENLRQVVDRHVRSLEFPAASGMGIFFAIAIPLDIPDKSISLSYYFEANYGMPTINDTLDTNKIDNNNFIIEKKRSIDRRLLYNVIQNKIERSGYSGRACLLRIICESTDFPYEQSGLIGDIIRIIFTPSTSLREVLPTEIYEAERTFDCQKYHEDCPLNFLDLISYE